MNSSEHEHRYSGNLRVRLPVDLHALLAAQAKEQGVSLNTLIVAYLSGAASFKKEQP